MLILGFYDFFSRIILLVVVENGCKYFNDLVLLFVLFIGKFLNKDVVLLNVVWLMFGFNRNFEVCLVVVDFLVKLKIFDRIV